MPCTINPVTLFMNNTRRHAAYRALPRVRLLVGLERDGGGGLGTRHPALRWRGLGLLRDSRHHLRQQLHLVQLGRHQRRLD